MIRWLVLFLVFAGPATAQETSLRPVARPEQQVAEPEADENTASDSAVATSLRPQPRTAAVAQAAETARVARVKGQICGDPDLQGDVLDTVAGRGACGVENAVRVKSVAGIRFPANPTMNCETAIALKIWVQRGAIPQVGGEGGGIRSIRTASDYACRNRNNQSGEKLSEHAQGRAIDIAGIKLNSVVRSRFYRAGAAATTASSCAGCGRRLADLLGRCWDQRRTAITATISTLTPQAIVVDRTAVKRRASG